MKHVLSAIMLLAIGYGFGVMGSESGYQQRTPTGELFEFRTIAKTDHWDVLVKTDSTGRDVSLGQNGQVRVTVLDDGPSLYVLTFKEGQDKWEGRLMDMGNDGTVEVANLTGRECSNLNNDVDS